MRKIGWFRLRIVFGFCLAIVNTDFLSSSLLGNTQEPDFLWAPHIFTQLVGGVVILKNENLASQ